MKTFYREAHWERFFQSDSVYFDFPATTPVHPEVLKEMHRVLSSEFLFGNTTSRSHVYGWDAFDLIEEARDSVAQMLSVDIMEIFFTSGATESNHLSIQAYLSSFKEKGHIVTTLIEHKSVLEQFVLLEKQGWEVSYLAPDESGVISFENVLSVLREDTCLVSVMYVNNETGAIQPISEIGEYLREKGIYFHVDATQMFGKAPLDLSVLPVDALTASAHKFFGPKGVGLLYLRRAYTSFLQPIFVGGGHEKGLRSGTLAQHQIVGLASAMRLFCQVGWDHWDYVKDLRVYLLSQLSHLPFRTRINAEGIPHIANIWIEGVDSEFLMSAMPKIALSNGSACNSISRDASYVLKAMGMKDIDARSSIRLDWRISIQRT